MEIDHQEKLTELCGIKKGQTVVYYEGDLAYDRDDVNGNVVSDLARTAYRMYKDGIITLVQRKVANKQHTYQYIAQAL